MPEIYLMMCTFCCRMQLTEHCRAVTRGSDTVDVWCGSCELPADTMVLLPSTFEFAHEEESS